MGSRGKPCRGGGVKGKIRGALGGQATACSCIACHGGFWIKPGGQPEPERLGLREEVTAAGRKRSRAARCRPEPRGRRRGRGVSPSPRESEAAALVTPSICRSLWRQRGCHRVACSRPAAGCWLAAVLLQGKPRGLERSDCNPTPPQLF